MEHLSPILPSIKSRIQTVIPESKVFLFGSRAFGRPTAESDWDILVLTKDKHPKATKRLIQDELFPISLEFSVFINLMVVHEDDWNSNPGYYSLRKNIGNNVVVA